MSQPQDPLAARIEIALERRTSEITAVAVEQSKQIKIELRFIWQWLRAIAWTGLFGFTAVVLAILYRSGVWPG